MSGNGLAENQLSCVVLKPRELTIGKFFFRRWAPDERVRMDEQQAALFHEVPHPVSLVASMCPPTLRPAPTQGAVLERATWMARDTQHEMVDFCADWREDVYGSSDN